MAKAATKDLSEMKTLLEP